MMLYFNTWEAFIKIDDLKPTSKLLLIWIVGYSQARISFRFTNNQIAKNFIIHESTAKAAVKELKDKKYIEIDFPGSPFRKLKWADKARVIYKTEKRKVEEAKENKGSTGTKNHPVDQTTSRKNLPVTSRKNYPVPGGKTYQSIINNNNYIIQDENPPVDNNTILSPSEENPLFGSNHSFETFWESYPRKAGKAAAEKVWSKLSPDEKLFGEIMAALEQHKSQTYWTRNDGQYIPHASTWLNGRRWQDEIQAALQTIKPIQRDANGLTPRERLLGVINDKR